MKFSDYLDSPAWDKLGKDTAWSKFLLAKTYVTDSIRRTWTKARHARDSIDKAQAAQEKATADAAKKAIADAAKNADRADAAKKTPPPPKKSTPPAIRPDHPWYPAARPSTASRPNHSRRRSHLKTCSPTPSEPPLLNTPTPRSAMPRSASTSRSCYTRMLKSATFVDSRSPGTKKSRSPSRSSLCSSSAPPSARSSAKAGSACR